MTFMRALPGSCLCFPPIRKGIFSVFRSGRRAPPRPGPDGFCRVFFVDLFPAPPLSVKSHFFIPRSCRRCFSPFAVFSLFSDGSPFFSFSLRGVHLRIGCPFSPALPFPAARTKKLPFSGGKRENRRGIPQGCVFCVLRRNNFPFENPLPGEERTGKSRFPFRPG